MVASLVNNFSKKKPDWCDDYHCYRIPFYIHTYLIIGKKDFDIE